MPHHYTCDRSGESHDKLADLSARTTIDGTVNCPEVMSYPQDDCHFILDTNASDVSIGAVISQIQEGRERVIMYACRTFNKAEKNYFVTLFSILKSLPRCCHSV